MCAFFRIKTDSSGKVLPFKEEKGETQESKTTRFFLSGYPSGKALTNSILSGFHTFVIRPTEDKIMSYVLVE